MEDVRPEAVQAIDASPKKLEFTAQWLSGDAAKLWNVQNPLPPASDEPVPEGQEPPPPPEPTFFEVKELERLRLIIDAIIACVSISPIFLVFKIISLFSVYKIKMPQKLGIFVTFVFKFVKQGHVHLAEGFLGAERRE